MDLKNLEELKTEWNLVIKKVSTMLDVEPDLQGVLFIIGIQELGQGPKNFSKAQKQDLMHIATCRLLSMYGYYVLAGQDEDGWPHWELVNKLPLLTLKEQDLLLKRAAIEYFKDI